MQCWPKLKLGQVEVGSNIAQNHSSSLFNFCRNSNNNFAGICIVFNVVGCLIRGRRRWSVTYTSPRGLRISEFGIEGHFRRENLTSFLVGWKTLLTIREPTTSRTPRLREAVIPGHYLPQFIWKGDQKWNLVKLLCVPITPKR